MYITRVLAQRGHGIAVLCQYQVRLLRSAAAKAVAERTGHLHFAELPSWNFWLVSSSVPKTCDINPLGSQFSAHGNNFIRGWLAAFAMI